MTVTRFPRAPNPAAPAAEAAFLVNIQTGSIVGAGRFAAMVLDFDATRAGGHPLDAAMPAVSTLRAFALPGATTNEMSATLVLWSRRGSVTAKCILECMTPGAGNDPVGALIRVTITNIHELLAQRADLLAPRAGPARTPVGSSAGEFQLERIGKRAQARSHTSEVVPMSGEVGATNGLMAPRDDRATLQLIARRIEDGVKLNSMAQPPEVTPVPEQITMPAPVVMGFGHPSDGAQINAVAEQAPSKVGTPPPLQKDEANVATVPLPFEANDNKVHAGLPAATALLSPAALAQLLAQTAHDIKTPLSAISAASEIIRDERLGPAGNERYRTYAADIHASARHALAIVDRLMKMPSDENGPANTVADSAPAPENTKPSAAQPEVSPEAALAPPPTVDLNSLIVGCAQELKPLTDAHQLHLTMRLDPAAPHVLADAVGLKQSLLNVLTNAMKFTPAGGTLHLATEKLSSHSVLISVRDTGCGMTKGAIARLLNPDDDASLSASAAKGRTATGLGLGLPQVRAFCRANNAGLAIDSTLNRGTIVSLMFNH